ncbi:MAG: hypothetical protein JO296_03785 [Pseudonocardiales bacterium]|nr:hypothetical protein [Pseudonocardiales bacterium]
MLHIALMASSARVAAMTASTSGVGGADLCPAVPRRVTEGTTPAGDAATTK